MTDAAQPTDKMILLDISNESAKYYQIGVCHYRSGCPSSDRYPAGWKAVTTKAEDLDDPNGKYYRTILQILKSDFVHFADDTPEIHRIRLAKQTPDDIANFITSFLAEHAKLVAAHA